MYIEVLQYIFEMVWFLLSKKHDNKRSYYSLKDKSLIRNNHKKQKLALQQKDVTLKP